MLASRASMASASRAPGAGSMSSTSRLEEEFEQPPAGGDVQVLFLTGPEDVLEQGEAVQPHLQPVAAEEPLEAAHEHGQHLVHIHHHQRGGGVEAKGCDLRREEGSAMAASLRYN